MRSILALIFVFALLGIPDAGSFPRGGAAGIPANWYSAAWGYRKLITIDHTKVSSAGGETYANFPVLFSEATDANLATHALTTGNDILFTKTDGITKLNHEIELYASGTGQLVAWVQVSGLSTSVDTTLYMYYGNPSASNQQNVAATWDSHFKGVYHLGASDTGYSATRYGSNPIISSGSGGWTDSQVYDNFPMADPNNSNQLLLFMSGMAAPVATGHECIGRYTAATSNPFAWTPYASNPIICDSDSRRLDSVVYTGGTFYLYSSDDTTFDIHLYTSTDGISFTPYNSGTAILTPTGQGCSDGTWVSQGAVWLEGGTWTMIYAYRNGGTILPGFRYATSSDGKTWTKGGCTDILSHGPPGSTDSTQLEWHQITKTGSTYVLTYECFNGYTYTDCVASSSSLTSGWVKSGAQPMIQPSGVASSFDQYQLASPAFFNVAGTEYVMYSGGNNATYSIAHWSIGMMTVGGGVSSPLAVITAGAKDSTGNANNLVGTNLTAITGQMDGADSLDGSSSAAGSMTSASMVTSNYTIQFWIKPSSLSQNGYVFMNGTSGPAAGSGYSINVASATGGAGSHLTANLPSVAFEDSGYAFPDTTTWRKVDVVNNGGTTTFNVNNVAAPNTFNNTPSAPTQQLRLGGGNGGAENFAGSLDEARFSDTVRSAGWLTTEYTMQSAPGSFYTVGAEVPY